MGRVRSKQRTVTLFHYFSALLEDKGGWGGKGHGIQGSSRRPEGKMTLQHSGRTFTFVRKGTHPTAITLNISWVHTGPVESQHSGLLGALSEELQEPL